METRSTTMQMPRQQRAASLDASSYDPETRVVPVVWTTGAPVLRWFRGEQVNETLDLAGCDMSRLQSGAPVLDSHRSWGCDGIRGVVLNPVMGKTEGTADLKLSGRAELEGFRLDVAEGIIRNTSVGYDVKRYELIITDDGQPNELCAREWQPLEISFVPVGADALAGTRSADYTPKFDCIITEVRAMATPNNAAAAAPENQAPTAPNAPDVEAIKAAARAEAQTEERERVAAITQCGRATGQVEMARGFADGDTGRAEAIDAMLKSAATAQEASNTNPTHSGGDTGAQRMAVDMEAHLLHRAMPGSFPAPADDAFAAASLVNLMGECLRSAGVNTRGMSADSVIARAMVKSSRMQGLVVRGARGVGLQGTSDFPLILANVGGKVLRKAYGDKPPEYSKWMQREDNRDFRPHSVTQLSESPALQRVKEHGEIPVGSNDEAAESTQLETFGIRTGLSRQAAINDNLGAFTRELQRLGRSALRGEADEAYAVLTGNPVMADGVALFHADHNNICGVTGGPSMATYAAASLALGLQTGLKGQKLSLIAKVIIVPMEHRFIAYQLFGAPYQAAAHTDARNELFNGLMVVADARLDVAVSNNPWYVGTTEIDSAFYGWLAGQQGPGLATREGWEVLGQQFRVINDFYASAIDHRAFVKVNAV